VIRPPAGANPFEFIVLSGQRAAQLMAGCVPKVDTDHKIVVKAQLEVATGKVAPLPVEPAATEL
jgi:DNA-directed RNA polymerase subunit K/omega